MRWGIAGATIVAALAVAVTIASVSGRAWAASSGPAASYWHIGYYTPSGRALSLASAPAASGSVASLNFTNQDNTALLVTDNAGQFPTLLGNLTGKSVSATFTISGLNGGENFTYYGEGTSGNSCQPGVTTVRYFFETSSAGGFSYTDYWWSNPVHANLSANGSVNLSPVSFDGANWSDWNGLSGTTESAGFNAAVSHVTMIGLSFGGGCFFENGVGTSDGSGTFTLNTFTVS